MAQIWCIVQTISIAMDMGHFAWWIYLSCFIKQSNWRSPTLTCPQIVLFFGTVSGNDIYAAFQGSPIFNKLENMMVGGLVSFKFKLTSHLIRFAKKSDANLMNGFILSTEGSFQCRCQFGYGRIQKDTWLYLEEKKSQHWLFSPFLTCQYTWEIC